MHIPGESKIFTPKQERLADLISDIHKHKIALPNFQRKWVWEPHMINDLIISVAYRYPAGSLLTMPVTTSSFGLHPFEGSGDKLKDNPSLMVLDGQQRLTSLYQALYRREGVQVKGRIYHFYLDIPVLMSDANCSIDLGDPYFDKALFYVTEEKNGRRVRYDRLQLKYELTTSKQEIDAGALPLWCIFDADGYLSEWEKNYLIKLSNADMAHYIELNEKWKALVQPWLSRIRNYPFPVVELRPDMPLPAICHIFEKVNSTGVPLDVFDLCTAILWAQGFHLNDEWVKTCRDLKEKNILSMQPQPLSGTNFIQGIALLYSMERKRANPNERIAVACRKQDLMSLKKNVVEKWWNVLIEGYKEASHFMTDKGIFADRILPYSTLIIPLTAIFADLKYRRTDAFIGSAWPKIEQWYWCCVFSQRYSSQVESNSGQDYEQVIDWIEGGEQPDVVRTFNFRSDVLQEITSIRNAIYKGVLCLLARNGAKDFSGGGKLSTSLFYEKSHDHHHIFPNKALSVMTL
ncbi:DUF262 domain-containing protein [Candidatus Poribacteria bacterium]|nr:DUF262 domain-containing protein [Candidatus Poribacteria bacterium]